ncbi:MAG: response regulator [Alphaproteobacteria bacterium]|nr:response regulator [Alphaproteobacteria bacterium]
MTAPIVLVVDDSAAMRKMLVKTLVMAGVDEASIATATDGLDALEQLEVHRPQLLVTDVTMPNMDGVDLLRSIQRRSWPEPMRIVACTSVSSSRTLLELVRVGCELVIRKPFDRGEVAGQLAELLTPRTAEEPEPVTACQTGYEALDTAVERVMERMAFTLAERIHPGERVPDPERRLHCRARIPLLGGAPAAFDLWATPVVSRHLARGLVGEVEDEDDLAGLEALAEFANILAGDWLLARQATGDPESAALELGTPELSVHQPGELELAAASTYKLDGAGFIHVVVDGRIAAEPAA